MKSQSFNATIPQRDGHFAIQVEIVRFMEENNVIIYCPSIDISAAGVSVSDAQREFSQIIKEYFDYCVAKKTLVDDLKEHGWVIKSAKKKYKAPTFRDMLPNNQTLQDIVYNKEYEKLRHEISVPQLV